ncbi:MAG: hypothetical protein U0U67_15160 [Chitinophagales bacterium]
MKKIIFSLLLIALFITPYACKKKGTDPDPIKPPTDTITKVDSERIKFLDTLSHIFNMMNDTSHFLKNKPLDSIRYYINGKWQLRFIFGGSVSERFYPEHSFVEFLFNTTSNEDSIKFYSDISPDFVMKRVYWNRQAISGIDSTYAYNYYLDGVNIWKIAYALRNDTLITKENASNGFFNVFTKVR